MLNLYTASTLEEIKKSKKINLALMTIFIVFSCISLVFFIIFANYYTRIIFSIISSVVVTILIFFFIFFLFKYLYIKRIYDEYDYLLNTKGTLVKCEVLKCSTFLTTLPDKSRCYEVLVKKDDKEFIYYLSEIFNYEDIKEGNCTLDIYVDYIKGYQYED